MSYKVVMSANLIDGCCVLANNGLTNCPILRIVRGRAACWLGSE